MRQDGRESPIWWKSATRAGVWEAFKISAGVHQPVETMQLTNRREWYSGCKSCEIKITALDQAGPLEQPDGETHPKGVSPMRFRSCALSFACLSLLALSAIGCNNTLSPLCGSARPVPVIGSLSPSSVSFAQVQSGTTLIINGSHFVSSSEVLVNSTPLAATVVSDTEMKVKLTTGVISGPGQVKIKVQTPAGNSTDVGCSSGGNSSVLMLTVN